MTVSRAGHPQISHGQGRTRMPGRGQIRVSTRSGTLAGPGTSCMACNRPRPGSSSAPLTAMETVMSSRYYRAAAAGAALIAAVALAACGTGASPGTPRRLRRAPRPRRRPRPRRSTPPISPSPPARWGWKSRPRPWPAPSPGTPQRQNSSSSPPACGAGRRCPAPARHDGRMAPARACAVLTRRQPARRNDGHRHDECRRLSPDHPRVRAVVQQRLAERHDQRF